MTHQIFDHAFPAWGAYAFHEPAHIWNRAAEKDGLRRRIDVFFVLHDSDVFDDRKELDVRRARFWKLISETPWLDWVICTKHPQNAARLWQMAALAAQEMDIKNDAVAWQPNVWIGTTVEDQQSADERVPHLLRVPAAVRFLWCEPLLGPVDLTRALRRCGAGKDGECFRAWCPQNKDGEPGKTGRHCPIDDWGDEDAPRPYRIDWVIGGGESGRGARPCDVSWLRSLRDQCADECVPYFNRQLGARPEMSPGPISWPCTDPNGGDPAEWPEDLRVWQFPESQDGRART